MRPLGAAAGAKPRRRAEIENDATFAKAASKVGNEEKTRSMDTFVAVEFP